MDESKKSEFPLILFLHMQKTAGMTLQELLRRHHGSGLVRRIWKRLNKESGVGLKLEEAVRRITPEEKLFMGHFCYGIHRHIPFPVQYITFFRDPIKRLVSLYYYSHNTPEAHYYKIAKDKTIEGFLLETNLLELDNGMTRLVSGDNKSLFINQQPFGQSDEQMLEKAKQNLDTFAFVGIQEEFNRSVMLLSKVLGWRNPFYVTLNVRKQKSDDGEALSLELLQELRKRNSLDIHLYEYARLRFEEDYKNQFSDAGDSLNKFERANRVYQVINRPLLIMRLSAARIVKKFIP